MSILQYVLGSTEHNVVEYLCNIILYKYDNTLRELSVIN